MIRRELEYGDVVQINPVTVGNKAFAACMLVVTEPKARLPHHHPEAVMKPETHDERCSFNNRSIDQYMEVVAENITEFGQHLVGVMGDPFFAYTVGLMPHAGHELIVYGLPPRIAAAVLNDIGACLREGLVLEFDTPDSRFTNLPVKFMRCGPQAQEVNGVARRRHGGDVPMVQVVLCDSAGKFPGEAGFNHAYMDYRQPLLQ